MRLQTRSTYIGSKIFVAKHVSKAFRDHEPAKVILKDYNYTFARYEKMGIILLYLCILALFDTGWTLKSRQPSGLSGMS